MRDLQEEKNEVSTDGVCLDGATFNQKVGAEWIRSDGRILRVFTEWSHPTP